MLVFFSGRVAKQKKVMLFHVSSCEELLAFSSTFKNPSLILGRLRSSTAPRELSSGELASTKAEILEVFLETFWRGTEELCFYSNLILPLLTCRGLTQLCLISYAFGFCRMLSISTTRAMTSKVDIRAFKAFHDFQS